MKTWKPYWRALVWILPIAASLGEVPAPGMAAEPSSRQGQCAEGNGPVRLELTIEGVRSAKGTISVAVYGNRPEDFLVKGKKLRKLRLPAHVGTVHGCVSLPWPGTYALAAYHDEDGDRHFTRNFLGLPEEGVAMSNDPSLLVNVPSFKDAAFTVNATNSQINIKMRYP